jgi:acylphosphatase
MKTRAVIVVQGLVQGVGYRYYVHRSATTLGLKGFAENLANGDVKIVVEGERGMVEELIKTARIGPRAAQVTSVRVTWETPEDEFTGFSIQ